MNNGKIKQHLKDECIKLEEEERKEKYIYNTIKHNTFEEKFVTLFGCSMLTLVPSMLAIAIFGIPTVAFPQLIPVALFGGSIGVGAIVNAVLEKTSFKLKERLKKITSAKKQSDLLEEEVEHQVKCEIANNKKKAMEQVLENLDIKNKIFSSISSNYIVNHNNKLTIDEITKNID